ncbi:GDSL esterase/lipase At5g55050-like isoform X1 [Humulus lupulus]|uniref:GDSL esterase/lipase At5g55050-like isoform X1 n=1 Tax=Humulus lupulus TaxID=3486 RepID=UPI002B41475B|nr:GDSL esterase/lipase At5g55050-like isoform X1 [Humulus lupulus]
MANDNIILVVIIVFFFCFCQFTTTSFSLAYPLVPAIYTFGDSLVDVGNNNYLLFSLVKANFPHNGIDFPTKKPTGRFCNGKNAVDLLAEKVGLPYSPPYLSTVFKLEQRNKHFMTGVNFASGGSGILNQTNQKNSLSLTKQVNSFIKVHKALNKQLGPSGLNQHISKSLFVIVTGSNDIFSYFGSAELRNKTTPSQYINSMVATFKGQVERLYNLGALRFVIVGIGVIGCTPSQRKSNKAEQCNEEVNSVAIKYNEALTSTLKSLKVEQKELNYSYFDGYSVMQNAIQKPATYGLFEIKAACCGLGKLKADVYCLPVSTVCSNRSSHLFWDASHPTETAHRIFVDYIFGGPLRFTFPLNVKQLIGT